MFNLEEYRRRRAAYLSLVWGGYRAPSKPSLLRRLLALFRTRMPDVYERER